MYTIKFTFSSNPGVYNTFLRAIKSLGNARMNRRDTLVTLKDRYDAELITESYNEKLGEHEYVFQFPDEKTYTLFLLKV